MAFWVVNHFDADCCGMRIGDTVYQISKESIAHILGFPIIGNKVVYSDKARIRSTSLVTKWKEQFPDPEKGSKRIFTSDLMSKLIEDSSGDELFKVNILLLITSLLASGIKCGTVNCRFLPFIKSVDEIPKMDWCGYVIDWLIKSKQLWSKNPSKNFYTGPLLFLVLWCAEMTRQSVGDAATSNSPLSYWTSERLKVCGKKLLGGYSLQTIKISDVFMDVCNMKEAPEGGSKKKTTEVDDQCHVGSDVHVDSLVGNEIIKKDGRVGCVVGGEHTDDVVVANNERNVVVQSGASNLMNRDVHLTTLKGCILPDSLIIQEGEKLFESDPSCSSQVYHDRIIKFSDHISKVKAHLVDIMRAASSKFPDDNNLKRAIMKMMMPNQKFKHLHFFKMKLFVTKLFRGDFPIQQPVFDLIQPDIQSQSTVTCLVVQQLPTVAQAELQVENHN